MVKDTQELRAPRPNEVLFCAAWAIKRTPAGGDVSIADVEAVMLHYGLDPKGQDLQDAMFNAAIDGAGATIVRITTPHEEEEFTEEQKATLIANLEKALKATLPAAHHDAPKADAVSTRGKKQSGNWADADRTDPALALLTLVRQ